MAWPEIPIRRVVECLDGRRVPLNREQRSDIPGDVPYWGAGGVLDYICDSIFNEPLVLVGEDGAPFFDKSKNVAFYIEGPAWVNNHIHALRAVGCEPRFLMYALNAVDYSRYITGTTRDKLTQDDLKRINIPAPSIGEQRRIADFLDAETSRIDSLVGASQRLREGLLERRVAGVIAAVSGQGLVEGLRPTKLPWLEAIAVDWPEIRLGLVAKMGSGHTPSRSRPEWWQNCTIPWITTGEVKQVRNDRLEDLAQTREMISEVGLANSAAELHPKGTVVLCRTASAGYSAVMASDMATSQDFVTWTCGPRLNPYYLLWCLRAMRSDLLGRLAMGSTHKTIYVPDLQMLRIPLPPLDMQIKIVELIRQQNRRIDGLVDAVDKRISLLAERRTSLITAVVTGQLDVTTASGRNLTQGV